MRKLKFGKKLKASYTYITRLLIRDKPEIPDWSMFHYDQKRKIISDATPILKYKKKISGFGALMIVLYKSENCWGEAQAIIQEDGSTYGEALAESANRNMPNAKARVSIYLRYTVPAIWFSLERIIKIYEKIKFIYKFILAAIVAVVMIMSYAGPLCDKCFNRMTTPSHSTPHRFQKPIEDYLEYGI